MALVSCFLFLLRHFNSNCCRNLLFLRPTRSCYSFSVVSNIFRQCMSIHNIVVTWHFGEFRRQVPSLPASIVPELPAVKEALPVCTSISGASEEESIVVVLFLFIPDLIVFAKKILNLCYLCRCVVILRNT